MSIKDWPIAERPREKLLERGPSALSDAELLAIFLRTGAPGKSAVALARELLNDFGGLSPLLAADRNVFCTAPGLGPAKFALLQAALEMARRFLAERLDGGESLHSAKETRHFLQAKLASYEHEVFGVLFLDNRHRVLGFDELFHGTLTGTQVHPREVVKRALRYNAAAVILAHNHPSGVSEPSQADQQITRRLQETLNHIEVRVLDHIIVGRGETTSLAERGLL